MWQDKMLHNSHKMDHQMNISKIPCFYCQRNWNSFPGKAELRSPFRLLWTHKKMNSLSLYNLDAVNTNFTTLSSQLETIVLCVFKCGRVEVSSHCIIHWGFTISHSKFLHWSGDLLVTEKRVSLKPMQRDNRVGLCIHQLFLGLTKRLGFKDPHQWK